MKKLALILAMLMVLPGAAFGLEMLNDNAMDQVTGQSGVHIAVDDIELFLNIDKIAWVDEDGYKGNGFGGAVGIENFTLDTIKIGAITGLSATLGLDSTGNPLEFDYSQTKAANALAAITNGEVSAITIDVTSAMPAITAGANYNNTALGGAGQFGGVVIGLPTVEINIPSMSLEPKFWDAPGGVVDYVSVGVPYGGASLVLNTGQAYGRLDISGITFTVLGGWVEIGPH